MQVHAGKKPFNCTLCDKSFAQSHHLEWHMRVHTGENPYNCTLCDKSFAQRNHLKQHMRIHTASLIHKVATLIAI
jgi:KRAB domain-containing zinc finger protein